MKYHANPLIEAAVVASVKVARKSKDPAATLVNCLSIEADHPNWTREEAKALLDCLPLALKSLEAPEAQ